MSEEKSFKDLVVKLIEIKKEQEELAIRKKELSAEWASIATIIQSQMEARDELEVDLGLGYKLAIRDNVRGIIKDAPKFIKYLIDAGNDGLGTIKINPTLIKGAVKEAILGASPGMVELAVQWASLSSFLQDACDVTDKKTWPPGCDVNIWQDVVLRKGKVKK